ncbi:MAG TPA: DUF4286 family protein [Flavobacteriales bacterium]|nr:DUF4286 family protein [Flavobacteriales bacterium]
MIIYNVTVNIDDDIHHEWVKWMREVHIPDVLKTGCFHEARFARVMVDEQMGITYSTQYLCDSEKVLQHYADNFAPALQKDFKDKYEGKFNVFRTQLEIVDVLVVNR